MDTSDAARLRRYKQYLDFYEGKQWQTEARLGEPPHLTYNYARAIVHKAAAYLFGKPYNVTVPPIENTPQALTRAAEVEGLLADVYDRQQLHTMDHDVAIDSAILGDGAYKVVWDQEADAPSVTSVDPQTLRPTFAPDDYRRLTSVQQTYAIDAGEVGSRFGVTVTSSNAPGTVDLTESWTETTVAYTVGHTQLGEVEHGIGRVPYVIFPNLRIPHSPWGMSDLVDLIDPSRELNTRMSTLAHILTLSGNPIAVLENVDDADSIRVGPGALWELPEGSKAYLLDLLKGGGAQVHIDYINLLMRTIHDIAETPRTAFGGTGTIISGAALEIELEPLIQKVARKRRIWEKVIRSRNHLILTLLSQHGRGADLPLHNTAVQWPSLLPDDRSQTVKDEVALVSSGIHSHQRAMDVLGEASPETLWQQVLDEAIAQKETPSVHP